MFFMFGLKLAKLKEIDIVWGSRNTKKMKILVKRK